MKFIFILLFLVLLFLLFPYFRIFVKRIILGIRIKNLCRRKGYTFFSAHIFPFLGRKNEKSCDFYIETEKEVLCVKLFAAKYKKSVLKFTTHKSRHYYFTNSIWLFSRWGQATMTYDSKMHPLPEYDFNIKLPKNTKAKTKINILLIHPKCFEIVGIPSEEQKRILSVGDTVYSMRLESGKTLLESLGK